MGCIFNGRAGAGKRDILLSVARSFVRIDTQVLYNEFSMASMLSYAILSMLFLAFTFIKLDKDSNNGV
jgi:hypothetical protein